MGIFNSIAGSVEYEERLVKQWISMYGALPRMQIKQLLNKDKDSEATKLIKNLVLRGELYEQVGGVFLAVDPRQRRSERIIKALWVLIHYRNKIRPDEHYPAEYPSEIYFLKGKQDNKQEYEILVLEKGEEFKLRHLRTNSNVKYIIVVPTIEESYISTIEVPDIQYIFATVTYGCSGEAEVELWKPNKVQTPAVEEPPVEEQPVEEPYYDEYDNSYDGYYEENDEANDEGCDENVGPADENFSEEEPTDTDIITTEFGEEDDENE